MTPAIRSLLLSLLLFAPVSAWAQWPGECPAGTASGAIGCQPQAASPLSLTDLVLGWQIGQTPHTRAMQVQQILNTAGSTQYAPLASPTFTGSASATGTLGVTGALSVGNTINLGTTTGAGLNTYIQTPNGSNIVLNPQGNGAVSTTSQFTAPRVNAGGVSLTIPGASPDPILHITAGLTGTVTSSATTFWNDISISGDAMSVAGNLADFMINHNFGGVGFVGARTAFVTNMVQTGAVAGTPGVFANVISGGGTAVNLNNTFGGSGLTPATAAGYATGFNPYLHLASGFINGGGGSGQEIDVQTDAGSSFIGVNGLGIFRLGTAAVQGVDDDEGVLIGGQPQSAGRGWKVGLSIGGTDYYAGTDPAGTLIQANNHGSTLTAAHGVDFSLVTFSTDAFKSTGFTVDGSGNTTTATVISGGCKWSTGTGSPNGAVVGSPCDIYTNKSGGAGTTFYVKESGSATNTGWVGK